MIHDIKHANDPVDHCEGGGNDGTDEVRHNCRSSQSSLAFDALLLSFAAIWFNILLQGDQNQMSQIIFL